MNCMWLGGYFKGRCFTRVTVDHSRSIYRWQKSLQSDKCFLLVARKRGQLHGLVNRQERSPVHTCFFPTVAFVRLM